MNDKAQMLTALQEIFDRWEKLLAGMSQEQITAPELNSQWSIKDEIAHLRAWQQISIARLEAALQEREPVYPEWPTQDPDPEGETDRINQWIYEKYHAEPWSVVYQNWRKGFLRFLELADKIPEKDLLDEKKYAWSNGYALMAVLEGSCEHHAEHIDHLLDRQHGNSATNPEYPNEIARKDSSK